VHKFVRLLLLLCLAQANTQRRFASYALEFAKNAVLNAPSTQRNIVWTVRRPASDARKRATVCNN